MSKFEIVMPRNHTSQFQNHRKELISIWLGFTIKTGLFDRCHQPGQIICFNYCHWFADFAFVNKCIVPKICESAAIVLSWKWKLLSAWNYSNRRAFASRVQLRRITFEIVYFFAPSIISQYYNPATQAMQTKYQLGFLPLGYYRVEFRWGLIFLIALGIIL